MFIYTGYGTVPPHTSNVRVVKVTQTIFAHRLYHCLCSAHNVAVKDPRHNLSISVKRRFRYRRYLKRQKKKETKEEKEISALHAPLSDEDKQQRKVVGSSAVSGSLGIPRRAPYATDSPLFFPSFAVDGTARYRRRKRG